MPMLIKNLGASFYGGYALLISTFGFLFGISAFGAGFKINRYLPSTSDYSKRAEIFYNAFYFNLLTIALFSSIFIVFSKIFKSLFFGGAIEFSSHIILYAMIGNLIHHYFTNYFRYTHRLKHFAVSSVLVPYLFIIMVYYLTLTPRRVSLDLLVICNLSAILIPDIPLIFLTLKEIGFKGKLNIKLLLDDIKTGYPVMLSYMMDFILSGGDRFVISYFLTVTSVAYYNPAYTLGIFIILIPKALSVAVQPALAKAFDAGNADAVNRLMSYCLKFFLWLIVPFIIASVLLSKSILTVLATPEIAEKSYLISPIISLGALFYGLILIYGFILFLFVKTKEIFYANIISAVLNIVLNIVFIYIFKTVIVAAITTLMSYMISFFYVRRLTLKYFNLNFTDLKKFLYRLFIIALFWSGLLYVIDNKIETHILFTISAGFFSYMIISFLTGIVKFSDLKILTGKQ